tara:strand:- start:1439 stop:1756 length:318 start_codon:yes stop_codon:yes gene_type:complete
MNKHFPYQFHEIDQIRKKTEALEQRLEDSIKTIDESIEIMRTLNKTINDKPVPTGKLLTINEVSRMAGLSPYIVKEDIKSGKIKSDLRSRRHYISEQEADKYTNH